MFRFIISAGIVCLAFFLNAQNALEVDGKAKISVMEKDNNADSVVVRLNDGTLGVRDVSTLNSSPWYIGKDTLGGIVFYLYKGNDGLDHGLIVSKTESSEQWQSTTSVTNANRTWDGLYNMTQMVNSPSKTYVQSLGGEWYLPSIDELNKLWGNRFHVNKALFNESHTLLSTTDGYWSSLENDLDDAFAFGFRSGSGFFDVKTNSRPVRGIRSF